MEDEMRWSLTTEEKRNIMNAFAEHLPVLRAKAGISQEELSNLIGVSRQTYGSVERNARELTWNTFLSLLLFFDYNNKTHEMLHTSGAFPDTLIKKMNPGMESAGVSLDKLLDKNAAEVLQSLDDQALRSIKTMIMVEYARCTSTPGEVVVKAFDGMNFNLRPKSEQAEIALQSIKKRKKNDR